MPNTVRYFDSDMSGAPSLSGTAGALIGVLDACLVDGFGSVTVDSLGVASDVATATVSAGHQFAMLGNTGPVIRISGANPTALNDDWRITVTSTTQFTFATSGIGDQTASGTISAKRAPAEFSKTFTDTNKAVYRSDDITGTQLYLRIDDTGTTSARVRGYETMSGMDTGLVGPFPTDAQFSGGFYVYKSNAATSDTRDWRLYADSRLFFLFIDSNGAGSFLGGMMFGDGNSYVASDAYGAQISGSLGPVNSWAFYVLESASHTYLCRDYSQLGSSISCAHYSHGKSNTMGASYQTYPAPTDNAAHFWPIEYWDSTSNARGLLPGTWNPVVNAIPDGTAITDIPQLADRTILVQKISTNYTIGFDLTGPWR